MSVAERPHHVVGAERDDAWWRWRLRYRFRCSCGHVTPWLAPSLAVLASCAHTVLPNAIYAHRRRQ